MSRTGQDGMWIGLREFLDRAEATGEVETVRGASWDKEMSTISHLICGSGRDPVPALLFDDIPGYPSGYRTQYGQTNSMNRLAIAYGMTPDYADPMNFIREYHERSVELEKRKPIDPEFVPKDDAPLFTNTHTRDDVNLFSLPVPLHHEHDGGRYIGTADCVITKNVDLGRINVGTYRMQAFDETTCGVLIEEGHHGRKDIIDHFERTDEPMPIAATFGQDPTLFIFSSIGLNHEHEYGEFAHTSGVKGRPFPLVEGPETGLPLPANAEIAIEGYIHSDHTRIEGPFGEWAGYYATEPQEEPVVTIESLYHRDDPILTCAVPAKPPYDYSYHKSLTRSANLWNQIENAGVPSVTGVWRTEAGGSRLFNVVRINQEYPGHSRQAAYIASHTQAGGASNRWTVVVDDDVNPTDLTEVVWAMSTRCDPATDIEILRKGWAIPSSPGIDEENPLNSRAIIDATIPYDQVDTFPTVVESSSEVEEQVMEKWGDLIKGP